MCEAHRHGDNAATFADGLGRIDDEVHDDLPKLRGIGLDRRDSVREVVFEHDLLADAYQQQVPHLFDQLLEIQGLDGKASAAAVGQELPAEIGGPPGGNLDALQAGARRGERGHFGLGQVGVAQNPGQQVVEVVRDTTREHAQTFQFLGVQHLLLQIALIRDIAANREHDRLAAQLEGAREDLHGANLSVAPPKLEFQPVHVLALGQRGVHGVALAGIHPRRQLLRRLAQDLLSRVSRGCAEAVVASDDCAVRFGQGHGTWNELEDTPKAFLGLAQGALLVCAVGDVLDDADHEHGPAESVLLQLTHAVNPADATVVGAHDAIAPVEIVSTLNDILDKVAMHFLALIGMHQAEPTREILVEGLRDAEKDVERSRAVPGALRDVEAVGADVRDMLGSLQEPFAFAQSALAALSLGDVEEDRGELPGAEGHHADVVVTVEGFELGLETSRLATEHDTGKLV